MGERVQVCLNASLANLVQQCIKDSSQEPGPAAKKQKVVYVHEDLSIVPAFKHVPLHGVARTTATQQAIKILHNQDALGLHLLDVRVVSTYDANRALIANHINVRCKPEFTTMLHHERGQEVIYCFMASEQLEPIVIVTAIHASKGKLLVLTLEYLKELEVAIEQFKVRFGLSGESYAYTRFEARQALQQHSQHFHLKIRIPSTMYLQVFPMMQVLGRTRPDVQRIAGKFEPFNFKFNAQATQPWLAVKDLILQDVYEDILRH